MEAYQETIKNIFRDLTTRKDGLTNEEALRIKKNVGSNAIPRQKAGFFTRYIKPVINLMMLILFLAAMVQLWLYYAYGQGSLFGPAFVLLILFINIIIGFRAQYKAEKTLESLEKLTAFKATVLRDGKPAEIDTKSLVPGDIILLKQGDFVSADARVFEAYNLSADESVLTGEAKTVSKISSTLDKPNLQIQEQSNMVFNSTFISSGTGRAVVIKIGINTEIGKITKGIATMKKEEIPLHKHMNHLTTILGFIILGIITLLGLISYFNHPTDLISEVSWLVSMAVAAIPLNFPLITTLILLIGVLHLSKKQAIVRNLNAIETMGRLSVICSDKTGTLTKHQMTVQKIFYDNKIYDVTGTGYSSNGDIVMEGEKTDLLSDVYLWNMLINAAINNNAELVKEDVSIKKGKRERIKLIGMPTEGALLTLTQKAGIDPQSERLNYQVLKEFPFSSDRKRMTKVVYRDEINYSFTKGAPEKILEISSSIVHDEQVIPLSTEERNEIKQKLEEFASNGLRTLAFAYKIVQKEVNNDYEIGNCESDLIFSGMVGIIDPPREGVKESIQICTEAGIQVKMITGDHPITAKTIAKRLDIFHDGDNVATGAEIESMTPEEISHTSVFSRVSPDDKFKIVEALQSQHKVVAMTGDGVNDTMALEKADVGIAMGLTGTDVAKNAADLVLTDDSFNTIETAVFHGRGLFNNIRSNIVFLLNVCLIELFMLSTISISLNQEFFNQYQLLLFYGTIHFFLPIGLMLEKYDPEIMKLPPKDPKESLINSSFRNMMLLQIGVMVAILSLIWFLIMSNVYPIFTENMANVSYYNPFSHESHIGYANPSSIGFAYQTFGLDGNTDISVLKLYKAQTMVFIVLVFSETWIALESRSDRRGMFKIKINPTLVIFIIFLFALMGALVLNPFTRAYLHLIPLNWIDWTVTIGASVLFIIITEIWKKI
ncbi:MAG: cation-translocating P-type ATPase [Promethearchaeota archaeon]